MEVQIRHDKQRGCGFRKPGGLYLVADGPNMACGKMPIPLTICPTCSSGIHFSRSWTWVNGTALLAEKPCAGGECERCPLAKPIGRCGLLWIGEKFYKTPADWTHEAIAQGVSRRIPVVPRDFKLGETRVLVAHLKCIKNPDESFTAGIFSSFTPKAVEYVVTGDETPEELESLGKRGITPVKIEIADAGPELAVVKPCPCGSGNESWELVDARGIYCCRVCEVCEDEKKSHYRPEIFEDSDYEADEPIEAE